MGSPSGSEGAQRFRLAALATGVLLGLLLPQGASAATIYVTNTDDAGPGSLRRAIEQANEDPTHDVIEVLGSGTVNAESQFEISSDVTINAQGPLAFLVRSANQTHRVFDITAGDVLLHGLWVGYGSNLHGGGIRLDGGGTLTLDNAWLVANEGRVESYVTSDDDVVAEAIGGGILVESGDLVARRSRFENAAFVTIQNSGSGSALGRSRGGTVAMLDGHATISDSEVGGTIGAFVGSDDDATAVAQGGSIYLAPGASLEVRNSTLEDGHVRVGATGPEVYEGGAIWNGGTPAILTGVTFSNNVATPQRVGDPLGDSGSIFGGAILENTLLTSGPLPLGGENCNPGDSTITSLGHNLEYIAEPPGPQSSTCGLDQPTDIVGEDPLIGDFLDYGGDAIVPTYTNALKPGSPAIDAGVSAGLARDQRGRQRPFDFPDVANAPGSDGADIGAFERQAVEPPGGNTDEPNPQQPPRCLGEWVTIRAGSSGGGVVHGTPARDVILGSAEQDLIRAGRGPDLVCAGGGDDEVRGGRGRDGLDGRSGDDELRGRGGDDAIRGGPGSDELRGDGGHDLCDGGPGTDRLIHC